MAKYKPGDRVRVRKDLKIGTTYYMADGINRDSFEPRMARLKGKIVTIEKITDLDKYWIKESAYNWTDEMLEPVINETIIIYRKDSKVIALDKTTGKKAEAKCSPEDEFDFYIGADLAYKRLRESAPNFKLGEIVIALPDNNYGITTNGWIGRVTRIRENGLIDLYGLDYKQSDPMIFTNLNPSGFRSATDTDITIDWLEKVGIL